jgi:hypothetical protein
MQADALTRSPATVPQLLTTADVADMLGVRRWQIARLYEDGTLSEPLRIGRQRAIDPTTLPAIIAALSKRRWLMGAVNVRETNGAFSNVSG